MSPRLPRISADQLLRALHRDGWYDVRHSGSHVVLKHSSKPGRVVIPKHSSVTLALKVVEDTLNQTGLTAEELVDLL